MRRIAPTAPALLAVFVLAALAPLAGAQQRAEAEKKLYRWTDSTGKVHYTDALPPEVVNQARAELSARTGLVRAELDRALTAEERQALEAQLAAESAARTRAENSRRAEEAKVSAFRTEEDLRKSYSTRQAMIDDTLASLEAAIASQRSSLHQQLGVAGDAELAGRPVPERVVATINELRREVYNQEQARLERAAEKQVINEELERLVALLKERQERGLVPPGG
jgi:hypothetical protein